MPASKTTAHRRRKAAGVGRRARELCRLGRPSVASSRGGQAPGRSRAAAAPADSSRADRGDSACRRSGRAARARQGESSAGRWTPLRSSGKPAAYHRTLALRSRKKVRTFVTCIQEAAVFRGRRGGAPIRDVRTPRNGHRDSASNETELDLASPVRGSAASSSRQPRRDAGGTRPQAWRARYAARRAPGGTCGTYNAPRARLGDSRENGRPARRHVRVATLDGRRARSI